MKFRSGWVICGLSMLSLVGCASSSKPESKAEAPVQRVEQDEFEVGSGKAPTPNTLYSMARLMTTQGKDAQAEAILVALVKAHPEFVPSFCALAESQMRSRKVNEAIRTLNKGLTKAPKNAVLENDIGMCLVMKKDYAGALGHFTTAAGISPDDSRYRANMAMALGMMGRYDESLALYCQILTTGEAHYNLGVLCAARNDDSRAAKEFKLAESLKRSVSAIDEQG